MSEKRMPVIFSGHGSPMIAISDNEITHEMRRVGREVIEKYGKPKAILSISGHWFTDGTYVQSAGEPRQIYDMYGFPKELYDVKYPVTGCAALTKSVQTALGDAVSVNDTWGIDHGTWTVLVHMFPDADIPVVQLSVNKHLSGQQSFELGTKLQGLRDEGYLIFGSGNVVHNLMRVDWNNDGGTDATVRFNDYITDAIISGNSGPVIRYGTHPDAGYTVPTPDHYLPLLYCLGAAGDDHAEVFNKVCDLGSMAMTGFIWGF
jgi:4,5-DOPA dioxygenase extradiol